MKLTREKLNSEKKVNFYIPLGLGEKAGIAESVTINGYRTVIKKGVMVAIPLSIYKLLKNKYLVESSAGSEMLIDGSEKKVQALL